MCVCNEMYVRPLILIMSSVPVSLEFPWTGVVVSEIKSFFLEFDFISIFVKCSF